jgi:hydroxymethylpyrimidine/phosphomethylpyrimidine kinase
MTQRGDSPGLPGLAKVARAMTIAGSDSGGGAGVQADLKSFAAMGVYGTSVLTAITAQNTVAVTDVMELPVSLISSQIDAVVSDIGTDAVKTGMLSSAAIIEAVAGKIKEHGLVNLVVDPVMVAKSGDKLLQDEAVQVLRDVLVPLATLVTPNIPEAEALTGRSISNVDEAREAAVAIVGMGAKAVVVKGGHLAGPASDIFYDGEEFRVFTTQRISSTSTHGTGCTFASATAAGLAKGLPLRDSVSQAKKYVTEAIRRAYPMGRGHGPLNHFYEFWG